ncbi:MAG TPA: LysR family transcriptional regulator [Thermoanaerobaculia bacterium]|jgi:DNA-binding transcriptional LysR family regulator
MKLEAIDLNLLLVFEALVAEQNVTRAAERVGLTQPAVSAALSRLRRLLGDPLFERSGGRMQPTARARQLIGPIGDALARIRVALEAQPFRAAEASREFRIVASDYVELLVMPHVLAALAREAPGVRVRVLAAAALFDPPLAVLQSAQADLSIGFYPRVSQPHLVSRALFDERFVYVAKRSVPLTRGRLSLRTFLATPQVRMLYSPAFEGGGMVDSVLHARGLERRIGATVAHMTAVPRVVAATGFLGMIPERLANAEAPRHHLRILEAPVKLPTVTCMLVWHERAQHDPALAWLRAVIERVARAL